MITIEQGSWQYIQEHEYGEHVCSGGLGPCTGILMHECVSKEVIGGHFTAPLHEESDGLHDMVDKAKEVFLNSQSVKVVVSGKIGELESQKKFEAVFSELLSDPVFSITYNWPTSEADSIAIELDPESGQFWCD